VRNFWPYRDSVREGLGHDRVNDATFLSQALSDDAQDFQAVPTREYATACRVSIGHQVRDAEKLPFCREDCCAAGVMGGKAVWQKGY
jgi:hypothetical protein